MHELLVRLLDWAVTVLLQGVVQVLAVLGGTCWVGTELFSGFFRLLLLVMAMV